MANSIAVRTIIKSIEQLTAMLALLKADLQRLEQSDKKNDAN